VDFKFPDVGEGLSEGTLVKWLVKVGDVVNIDQPLAQVETDKAVVEIPSPTKGTISECIGKEGSLIKVGEVFVRIDETGQSQSISQQTSGLQQVQSAALEKPQTLAELMSASSQAESHVNVTQIIQQAAKETATVSKSQVLNQFSPAFSSPMQSQTRIKAVPRVKILAKQKGINLALIRPSGIFGHLRMNDLVAAASVSHNFQPNLTQAVSQPQFVPQFESKAPLIASNVQLPKVSELVETQQKIAEQSQQIRQKIESIAVNSAQLLQNALVANQNTQTLTLATPSVRRMARQKGLDVNSLIGSGDHGRITVEDLEHPKFKQNSQQYAQNSNNFSQTLVQSSSTAVVSEAKPKLTIPTGVQIPKPAPIPSETTAQRLANQNTTQTADLLGKSNPLDERVALSSTRKVIAKRMMESLQHTAIVTTCDEVDITDLFKTYIKEQERLKDTVRLSFLSFITKIVTIALKKYPVFNATLDEQTQELVMHKNINIGIAVATPRGLLVPVIKNADGLHIPQIAKQISELALNARDGKLGASELSGSTFTITNIGSIGGQMFTPIINYPEIAILGVGKAIDKPAVIGGEIKVRKMMWLSLSFDHRIVDGADAAYFLNAIKEMLESDANALLMETL
jgi:pyruvate dehydrogenase E2 component (dihydrolipoamide acetyltransferase)